MKLNSSSGRRSRDGASGSASGSRRRIRSLPFGLALGAAGLAGVLALSACASAGSASPSDAASTPGAGAVAGAPMRAGGGVAGEIAAISGNTLQVQDAESQTAVSYTDTTTITRTVDAALADVTVGVCVTAFTGGGAATLDAGGADATGGSDDSHASAADDTGAAASVAISDAVDGECTVGAFGAGGTPPERAPSGTEGATGATPPTDAPDRVMPTGAPGDGSSGTVPAGPGPGGGGFGGLTAGLVTAVSATSVTVQSTAADGTVSTDEVTVDDSTSFTRTESADASALVVGACVTAMGEPDDKGAVVATALALSAAGDDGCTAAVTMRGPGAGQRPAQSGATTGSGS
jgi:hypothetical protein